MIESSSSKGSVNSRPVMNCEEMLPSYFIAARSGKRAGDDDALLIMGELQPLSGKQLFIDILRGPLHQAALADEADRLITQGEQRDEEAQRGTGFLAVDHLAVQRPIQPADPADAHAVRTGIDLRAELPHAVYGGADVIAEIDVGEMRYAVSQRCADDGAMRHALAWGYGHCRCSVMDKLSQS